MDTTKMTPEEAAYLQQQEAAQEPRTRDPEARRSAGAAQGQRQKRPAEGQARPAQKQGASQRKPAPKKAAKKRGLPLLGKPSQKRRQASADDLSAKKRSYGNSKPKKKSTVAIMGQAIAATAQEKAAKRRARLIAQGKRSARPQQPTPAIIYTQPQVFNRSRLMIQLVTVTALVVAFVVGISIFFKVGTITVSGAEVYTEWAVQEASGISEGDNLMTFSRARAGALIKANLPYVKNVSFGIKLPDTVNIIIEEEDVVYAIKDQDEQWWLMTSEGRIVTQTNNAGAANYTQVQGVALEHPAKNQMAVAVETQVQVDTTPTDPLPEDVLPVVVPTTVTGEQRLDAAMKILKALEANDIVGSAASVNVAQIQNITLWYGTRYQVNLGDTTNLDDKIATMNDVIMEMSEYQSGILDISYTIWPNQVGYTPFA